MFCAESDLLSHYVDYSVLILLATEKGWNVVTSTMLDTLFSSGVVTDSFECVVINEVSVGSCSDESHEDTCKIVTVPCSINGISGPE